MILTPEKPTRTAEQAAVPKNVGTLPAAYLRGLALETAERNGTLHHSVGSSPSEELPFLGQIDSD